MKKKGKFMPFLFSALLLTVIFAFTPLTIDHRETTSRGAEQTDTEVMLQSPILERTRAWIDHGPIKIDGNQDFKIQAEAESWKGGGTESSPFIIQGYFIDRDGDDGNCIEISNTDVYFVIRNCNLTRAYASGRAGVWLENVTNGVVFKNTIAESYNGIYLDAGYISVESNVIDAISQSAGIRTLSLNNSVIKDNTVTGGQRGVNLGSNDFCEIENNTIQDATEADIWIHDSSNLTISHTNCMNAVTYGIFVEDCEDITLSRNNCSQNYIGIGLSSSSKIVISNCTLYSNDAAIVFVGSQYNYCEFCDIRDGVEYGIALAGGSIQNIFNWNSFRNSGLYHVQMDDTLNSAEYNYYGDYTGSDVDGDGFGDYPYQHASISGRVYDYHPLVFEPTYPVWNPAPEDQYLEYGESLYYDLNVTSPIPITSWQVSNPTVFTITNEGTIFNLETLDVGTYPICVSLTNAYEMQISANFSVVIDDTINPSWISQIKNKTYDLGASIEFQIIAWDISGIEHWSISDSENFSLAYSSYADTSMATIEATSALPSGAYPLTITVYDNHDNSATAQFYVNIGEEAIDTTSPIWIVLPYDVWIEPGRPFYLQVGAWDESGIAAWSLTGSSLFTIDEHGAITNTSILTNGVYHLEVRAFDPLGNYCAADFTVTVIMVPSDTTPTTTTTTTGASGEFDIGFLMSTAGIGLAVVAVVLGLGAFMNTRKGP